MNRPRFSPYVFMTIYCCVYVLTLAFDWPLFRYYPLHGKFCWGTQSLSDAGPQMVWYGLMASAGIIAAIVALLSPLRLSAAFSTYPGWILPVAAMFSIAFLLRHFFN